VAKICIVGPSKKFFSGVSAFTIRLSNALSAGNEVCVLLLRNLLPGFLYPGKNNVGRTDYSSDFQPDIKRFEGLDWNSPLSWLRGIRFLRREKPAVVILQWWTSSVAHLEAFLSLVNRLGVRASLILEMHEIIDPLEASLLPVRLYSRCMTRLLFRDMQAFIVHSAAIKEQLIKLYRIPPEKIFVIPHGVYDSYVQDYPQNAAREKLGLGDGFIILYFGMIRKYKGIPRLIEAFNRLPAEMALNSFLVIAGEDWGDEKGLADLAASSPYAGRIVFRPQFVPDGAVPLYFKAADVVALPYLRTAGSGVVALAVAFGKPVVISDIEGIRETLKDYRGAILVPEGAAEGFARELEMVYRRWQKGEKLAYKVPPSLEWAYLKNEYQKVIDIFSQ